MEDNLETRNCISCDASVGLWHNALRKDQLCNKCEEKIFEKVLKRKEEAKEEELECAIALICSQFTDRNEALLARDIKDLILLLEKQKWK